MPKSEMQKISALSIVLVCLQSSLLAQEPKSRVQVKTEFETIRAIDVCAKASERTEFDTVEQSLRQSDQACQIFGTTNLPARGVETNLLKYDATTQEAVWRVDLSTRSNLLYGGGLSPFSLAVASSEIAANFKQMGTPVPDRIANEAKAADGLSEADRSTLKRLGNSGFVLIPLYGSQGDQVGNHEASNAFGAKATVTTVAGTRYGIVSDLSTFGVTLPTQTEGVTFIAYKVDPQTAKGQLSNLDIEIEWNGERPCSVCYAGGIVERSPSGQATFSSPYEIKLRQEYVYVKISSIRLRDRRDNSVVFERKFPSRS